MPEYFQAELPDSDGCIALQVVPAMTGIADASAGRGLTARIDASGPVTVSTADPLILYHPVLLPVGLHRRVEPSFFRDTIVDGTISIARPPEAVAVTVSSSKSLMRNRINSDRLAPV